MIRVMLVDDEESALDYLEMLLNEIENIQVVGKYINPVRMLEQFALAKADVVLLDIQMPGIQGMELAAQLRQLHPHVRIIFTTAYSEYAIAAFEMDAMDYLLKPFSKQRLHDALARYTERVRPGLASAEAGKEEPPRIQLLGGLYIHVPSVTGGALSWGRQKEKELCAFLLHHVGKPMTANAIIEAVWPESDPFNARSYLYTCVSSLRKNLKLQQIPIEISKLGNDGYRAAVDGLPIDAAEFERLLDDCEAGTGSEEQSLDRLEQLYQGDYLQDCEFDWAIPHRDRLRGKYIAVLQGMYARSAERGGLAVAERCLRTILRLAPDSEKEGRALIELYIESGRRNEAIKLYRQLAAEVRGNLGVELEEETIRLYRRLIV
ncbi:MAG: histidine kinase [Paenibacillus sp.]|nr:histidine kinase [Paenibacillus sp.]